jgi:MarR family transcriptional regulator for hemolysin
VLVLIRSQRWGTQAEMAEAMGLTGATLTHHLGALEAQGLVRRWREPSNRRVQQTELTDSGIAMFNQRRTVATRHDELLRSRLSVDEAALLEELLAKLRTAVEDR